MGRRKCINVNLMKQAKGEQTFYVQCDAIRSEQLLRDQSMIFFGIPVYGPGK